MDNPPVDNNASYRLRGQLCNNTTTQPVARQVVVQLYLDTAAESHLE